MFDELPTSKPILNRHTFKALPAYKLPNNEVKIISSQARSALNV